jgi:GTP-binding protein
MQISALDYNSFLGVIGVGRIARGSVKPNTPVTVAIGMPTARSATVVS